MAQKWHKKSKSINIIYQSIMTKADIVNEVAKATGVEKVQVMSIVEAFMETVKSAVAVDNSVFLRGFGSFTAKQRAEKIARNISEETKITIPAHHVPTFKPSKSFSILLKDLHESKDSKRVAKAKAAKAAKMINE